MGKASQHKRRTKKRPSSRTAPVQRAKARTSDKTQSLATTQSTPLRPAVKSSRSAQSRRRRNAIAVYAVVFVAVIALILPLVLPVM